MSQAEQGGHKAGSGWRIRTRVAGEVKDDVQGSEVEYVGRSDLIALLALIITKMEGIAARLFMGGSLCASVYVLGWKGVLPGVPVTFWVTMGILPLLGFLAPSVALAVLDFWSGRRARKPKAESTRLASQWVSTGRAGRGPRGTRR